MDTLIQIEQRSPPLNDNPYEGYRAESIALLILQPTPFCNLDCDYCYLPNRSDTRRMSSETIAQAINFVLQAGLVKNTLSVVWHAGEPLCLPVDYYEEAFGIIGNLIPDGIEVYHSIQTNGTLINVEWCNFFLRHRVRVGLSIDGPPRLHDTHRKTRQGKPSCELAIGGAKLLADHGISFHVISVISSSSLESASSIYHFLADLGASEIGFNIEEIEGVHGTSTISGDKLEQIKMFWEELYETSESSSQKIPIREFRGALRAILTANPEEDWKITAQRNDQILPFRIISVDCEGGISTFSPELLGINSHAFRNFKIGKLGGSNLESIKSSPEFNHLSNAVMTGVHECSKHCDYFLICGGGAPSNKYFENADLSSTTTLYCQATIQLPTQVVLNNLERRLELVSE